MNYRSIFLICGLALLAHTLMAQDSSVVSLPTLTIQSTRQLESEITATRSLFVRQHAIIASEPGLSLQRVLRGLPGLQISERGHFGLGERILVRGMGYRAAFGVRGLQALLDGIPLTMPDGQSMLDVVDPAFIGRSELLRGPSSLFWGNASGGVLHLTSLEDSTLLRIRYTGGGYGLSHALASTGFRRGAHKIRAYASRVSKRGHRAHSRGSFLRAGLSARTVPSSNATLLFTLNTAIQDVLSPGSLTLEQLSLDPNQADSRYVNLSAGKASVHLQGGLTLHAQTRLGHLTATAYGIRRSLDNPLTFAWIELDRLAGGVYTQLQADLGVVDLAVGVDLRQLRDDRYRFNNDAGSKGTSVLLDQQERVGSIAILAGVNAQLSPRFGISVGTRLDRLHFEMTDNHLSNGDQSGGRDFVALSPSVGVFYRTNTLIWYTNIGTTFETPTTTELINSPSGRGGFNSDLGPQQTRGVEAGVRGQFDRMRLGLDFAVFYLHIRDRLLPQQGEDGRTWYSNGGENRHNGIELAMDWPTGSLVGMRMAYNYGSFVFLNEPGDGLHIPGVPTHQLHLTLHGATRNGWGAQIVLESASGMWANNTNSVQSEGFTVLDIYLARSNWHLRNISLQPFARFQNILDSQYVRSLVVNAFGGRFFEPAEGRSIQAGIGISLH